MILKPKLLLLPAIFMAFTYWGKAQIKAELVADIGSGSRSGYPHYLTAFKDQLVFTALHEKVGNEPMAFDGNSVKVLRDIKKDGDSRPGKYVEFKDHLYFSANSNADRLQAYRYNGDSVEEVDFGLAVGRSLYPGPFAANDSRLFYRVSNAQGRMELWEYDGHQSSLMATFDGHGTYLNDWCFLKDELLFSALDSIHGVELWRYDGKKVELIQDLNPDTLGSFPEELVVCDGSAYFTATVPGVYSQLFQYDGNTIIPMPGIAKQKVSTIDQLTPVGNDLYFAGVGLEWGWELWKYNRTTGLEVIETDSGKNLHKPIIMGVVDGNLYFLGSDGNDWKSMTLEGSKPVEFSTFQIRSSYYRNTPIVRWGNHVYMSGTYQSSTTGIELWRYHSPVSSPKPTTELRATVYPNPVANELFLSGIGEDELHWKVVDMQGRVADEGVVFHSFQQPVVNTSNLIPGYYLLQIRSGNATNRFYFIKS